MTRLKYKQVEDKTTIAVSFVMLLLISLIAKPAFAAEQWAFDVYLDKSNIGTHSFTLNDENQLTSKAKFDVKVLFFNAYNYDHTAEEQWQANCLTSLKAKTIENDERTNVTGVVNNNKFEVNNGSKTEALAECVMTFAYWNPLILEQAYLLNPQNADYLKTKISKVDSPSIVVKGQETKTDHYKIHGFLKGKKLLNIELWYDQNDDWVALKSITPEGYEINYKRK